MVKKIKSVLGQVIIMEVRPERFPVYVEQSLINSNDDFDFGGFRLVQEELELLQSQSRLFVFKFENPGTYTFQMSDNPNNVFFVSVQPEGTQCPSQAQILILITVPTNNSNTLNSHTDPNSHTVLTHTLFALTKMN